MKTTVKDVMNHLESKAPLNLQESYDNAGLIVGDPDAQVNKIMLCLDSTEEVIAEAIEKKCNMVIAHHPIVFRGLKKFNGANYVERTVIKAIKNDIAVYAIHTNLDNIISGVNDKIMTKLGIYETGKRILSPKDKFQTTGAGMIGRLDEPMEEQAFLEFLKKTMKAGCVKHTNLLGKKIRTVAVCGGAGSFLLPEAIKQGADVFVTSDFTYHQFFDADGKILIVDIGHYETEQFTHEILNTLIAEQFPVMDVINSSVVTNPVHYF